MLWIEPRLACIGGCRQSSKGTSIVEYALILIVFLVGVVAVVNGQMIRDGMVSLVSGSTNASIAGGVMAVPSYGSSAFTNTGSGNYNAPNTSPYTNACDVVEDLCDDNGDIVIDVAAGLGSQELQNIFQALSNELNNMGFEQGSTNDPLLGLIFTLANEGHAVSSDIAAIENLCGVDSFQQGQVIMDCSDPNDVNEPGNQSSILGQWALSLNYTSTQFHDAYEALFTYQSSCQLQQNCSMPFTDQQWAVIASIINVATASTLHISDTVSEGIGDNTLVLVDGSITVTGNSNAICTTTGMMGCLS